MFNMLDQTKMSESVKIVSVISEDEFREFLLRALKRLEETDVDYEWWSEGDKP